MAKKKKYAVLPDGRRIEVTGMSSQQTKKLNKKATTYEAPVKEIKITDKSDIGPVKTTITTEADRANMSLLEKMKYGVERGKQTPVGSLQNLYKAPKDSGLEIINKDALKKGNALQITAGTAGDIALNVAKGTGNLAEGVADFILYGASGIADLAGAQNASAYLKRTAQDKAVDNALKELEEKADKYSLLGEKTDSFLQGLGYVGGMIATGGAAGAAGMGTAGVSALTKGVMFAGSAGSGISEALNSGATDKEAITYGAIKGAGDVITEMMFGGLGKTVKATGFSTGLSSADDMLAKKLSGMVTSKLAKNLTEFGVKASAEGFEEVMAGIVSAVGKKITYMSEEDMTEILEDEELLEQFLMGAATSAAMQSGAIPGTKKGSLIESTKKGADFITGLTDNEQKVVDREIDNRIKEKEKDGKKLRAQEKNRIIDQVNSDLDKGYISIDTIESVLGGDTYNKYKELNDRETSLREEFDHLNKMKQGDMTGEQVDRRTELKQQLADLKASSEKGQIKDRLTKEVQEMVKSDRLMESYNEKSRRSQAYEADLTKYDEKQQAVIKKAAESGILNNTRRTHEFVDMIAKISADKGVLFDFTNNEKIKSSGFAVEGKTVNGYIKDGAVTLNINSAKALNKVVGHEITHVLEGTELYSELQNAVKSYAETKGEYSSRLESIKALYKDVEGANVENELTADLVGDYLFTDESFVSNLSAKNPNIFKKIYDEIKYLVKVVTAGSKEARELEKVKRTFEKAYKETANTPNDTKYMLQKEVKNVAERLSGREWNRVKEAVSNYNNLNHSYEKSADGDIIIPVNNKLVYTDGDYDSPGINKVIEFDSDTETEIDEARSWIYGAEKGEYTLADAYEIIEMLAGNEIISEYSEKGSKSGKRYDRRTGRGKSRSDSYHAGFLQERIGRANEIIGNVNNSQEASSEGDVFFDGEKNVKYSISEDDQALTEEQEKLIRDTIEVTFSKNYGKDTYTVLAYDKNDKATYVNHSATKEELSKYFGTEIAEEISKHMIELKNYKLDEKFLELPANKDSEGRALSKEQKEYFKNVIPELKDDNGNLKVLYHGTSNDFTQFNYDFIESNGTALGKGFYLTDSKDVANGYTGKNGKVMELYAVIEKPLSLTEKNIKKAQYKKFVKAVDKATKGEYLSNYGEVEYEGYNTVLNRALEDFRYDDNDVDLIHGVLNASGLEWEEGFRLLKKTLGYDGVIQQNFNGTGSTVFIPTLPEQIKSVTNANPTNNPDINLSLSKDDIAPTGNYNVYGKDIALEQAAAQEDIAPVKIAETKKEPTSTNRVIGEDLSKKKAQQIRNIQAKIEGCRLTKDLAAKEFDEKINLKKEEYANLTRKNSKKAVALQEQIINLKSQRDTLLKELDNKIKGHNKAIEIIESRSRFEKSQTKQQEYRTLINDLIGDTSTWKDKKTGIQYQVNTLQRNLRDIVRDDKGNKDIARADAIYDELQGKYNLHEAELNRESNAIKKVFSDMNINDAEDTYIQMLGEFRHNPATTLTQEDIDAFYNKYKRGIDVDKVNTAIDSARELYDSLFVRLNEVLSEQGMKEIPYRKGYFPHFTEDKQGIIAKIFNWKVSGNDIPTDIAGLTETFNPQRSWQSFNKRRTTDDTDYSFKKGLDTYLHGALDWIYHIEDIQKRRVFEQEIRYRHSEKGLQEEIDNIRNNPLLSAEEAQKLIDDKFAEARNPLNNFITDFRNATNNLAGKKSTADRGMEYMTNRTIYSVMTNVSNRVNANMVGGSVSSALTNFIPIVQSWGAVNPVDSLVAMKDTMKAFMKDDGMIDKSAFMTNRLNASENLYKSGWDRFIDKAGFMMEAIDSFTTQTVWRSKYAQNIKEGMSEQEAIKNADRFAEGVMAGRSRGNMPTIFNSKNPLTKLFTSFQLEAANQFGYLFKDLPQDVGRKSIGKLAAGYATVLIASRAYNMLYSMLTGRDAALDPLGILEELWSDLGSDDEEKEKKALLNLGENVVEELPFIGGLFGGGRTPISSAIPYDSIDKAIPGMIEDVSDGNWSNLGKEWLNPVYYLGAPVLGGQIKKFNEGLGMFNKKHPVPGSYTQSGNLRFPVEDTLLNRAQAAVFGQYANENARYYFDNNIAPLKEEQIEEYKELDIPIKEYWDYREGLKEQKKTEDKFDYIADLDLPIGKKNIMINNAVNRKEKVDLTDYHKFEGYEEFDFYTKNKEKYEFLKENNISYEEYQATDEAKENYDDIYSWYKNNPDKVAVSKAVTSDVVSYKGWTKELYDIRADKDSNGKSISGTAKEKKIDYINSLDIDYGAKLVLFKSQYKADDTYNSEIIDYLNEREDISAKERKTILKELGFTVDSKGNARW